MNTTVKCADNPALGMSAMFDFSQTNITDTWNATSGSVSHDANGGDFVIKKRFDSPTLQSNFYIFGGVVEVHMKSAQGQGIISSVVLQSDDLDEVDWEWIGGNNTHVETNYFGKGNTTSYDRAIYYPVQSPEDMYHNYTVQWTKDQIVWFVDTVPIRTLHAKDAYGGYNFPQTPMNVRIGIWAGGDESMPQGTIDWAGGKTDYTKAPFAMYVKNVTVTDYSTNASAYHWSDTSGSWDSIKVIA
jgi:beta-glucanase (GH16 family)